MRPYIWFGAAAMLWYVDTGARNAATYPGTSWAGYDSLIEAMDAARAAYVAEPA